MKPTTTVALTAATAEPARFHPSRRWPRGLLGMLALIVAVELAIAGRRLDFTTVAADDWRQTAEAATTKALGRDILCFGDSLIKYGVLPRVIESQTGLKAYNLAINAGPMPAEYFLLRRTLAAGARPRAIVADFFTLMLADQPRGSIRAYPELASVGDAFDLAGTARDGDLLTAILLGKAVPSIRCRFEIGASLMAALDGRSVSPWPANRRIGSTWRRHLGAQPMPAAPGQPVANPTLVADLIPDRWTADALNVAYFERFVSLAESRQIPVFWVIPPLGTEVEAGRLARGTAAAYTRFARAAQARHPNLVVLDARSAGYSGSTHIDPIHLNEQGAAILTGDIAQKIADHLAGSPTAQWSDLPQYANRAGPEPAPAKVATRRATGSPR